MSESWYNKFVIKAFNRELFNPKTSKELAFYKLKTGHDFNDKCIIVDNLDEQFEKFIYGNAFPADFKDISSPYYISESPSLEDELNWFFLTVRRHADKLNKFVEYKQVFDRALIIGNYVDASILLDEIEHQISVSLWSVEARLLLEELTNGTDANKLLLSELNAKRESDYVLRLVDFYSKKAEPELPVNRYNNELRAYTGRFKGDYKKETVEYYFFKAGFFSYEHFETLPTINAIEFRHSLIDRYLTFVNTMTHFVSSNALDDKQRSMLNSRLHYFSKKIKDPQVDLIRLFLDSNADFNLSEKDQQMILLIDEYTRGNYANVQANLRSQLAKTPEVFALYVLYCKSLINSNKDLEYVSSSNSLLNTILSEVFSLLKKLSDPADHARKLTKIAHQLSFIPISREILNFALIESRNDTRFEKSAAFSAAFLNPAFSEIYNEKGSAIVYLKALSDKLPTDSLTIEFLFHKVNRTLEDGIDTLEVSDERKKVYTAINLQASGQHKEALDLYRQLRPQSLIKSHLYELITSNIYKCLLENNELDSAVNHYIDTYFTNKYLVIKLDPKGLQQKIRDLRFRGISSTINLPLFFWLSGAEETKVSIATEKYLQRRKSKTPSEFIQRLKEGSEVEPEKNKLIYFFFHICTVDIFKHFVLIKGTKQKLSERLLILDYLLLEDFENNEAYKTEKIEIERQLSIQEGLEDYDESKIFINEKMIRGTLLKELESDFTRYVNYSQIIKHYPDLKVLVGDTVFSLKGGKSKSDEPVFSEDPLFDQFKQMFLEMRDKFLFSQYGLGEYLSARIRHGVFKSEIRPKFEKLQLITSKDTQTGFYKSNEFWSENLPISEAQKQKIQQFLSDFSRKVDNLIEEETLKKYLQIKTEEQNPEGWFDYEFSNLHLTIAYAYLKDSDVDFDSFVDVCMSVLWTRTDKNLEAIREKLKGEIEESFKNAISDLELSILKVADSWEVRDLIEKINTSKVYIQNDLSRIATWFNRSGKKTKDFELSKIIETSLQHSNRGFERKKIVLNQSIRCECTFRGEYYPYFIDLIRVFFDNILAYSGIENGNIPTTLEAYLLDTTLVIIIRNPVVGDMKQKREELTKYEAIDMKRSSTEGKSGFPKANRILKTYLGDQKNDLKFRISDADQFEVECSIKVKSLIV